MKAITALVILAIIAVAESAWAAPQAVTLVAHNQRSSSGTRTTLVWKDCGPTGTGPGGTFVAPCLYPALPWNIQNGVTGSDATWTWDSETGVLAGTGLYQTTSFISSQPNGTSVISDRVVNLTIDTANHGTTFDAYNCVEGTFMAGVGANACVNVNLGFNSILDSVGEWNVGSNPYCVTAAIRGDDFSLLDGHNATISPPQPFVAGTPNPRGGHAVGAGAAGPGCAATWGAFDLWTVVDLSVETGAPRFGYPADQLLVLSNGVSLCTLPVDIACQGTNWMTFAMAPVPVPTVGWLLAPAFGAMGWFRRRKPTNK